MALGWKTSGTNHDRGLWPVLLILLAAVLVPTACVLWFMNAAMSNEWLAVRQRLTDVYRQKVDTDRQELAAFWSSRLHSSGDKGEPPAVFANLARTGMFDSVIILDAAGHPVYPRLEPAETPADAATEPSTPLVDDPNWETAGALESQGADLRKAAEAYSQLAGQVKDTASRARALQAQARCLVRTGAKDQALGILTGPLAQPDLRHATDALGRLIAPNSQLLALQLIGHNDQRFDVLAGALAGQLNDYAGLALTSAQRRFLMESLTDLGWHGPAFPTLPAERLASEYLQSPQPAAARGEVRPTALPGIWQMDSYDGRLILLFKEDRLIADLSVAARLDEPFPGITTRLELPGRNQPGLGPGARSVPFLTLPASEHLPDWRLAVYLDQDPFAASARRAQWAYFTVGVSTIAVIGLLAVALASYLGRQIRLTRLKNDLIATVSHELKTPLASMRVLVDTLREGRCTNAQQAHEYFELLARENERLSRLIDNFLTFSRMERNKRVFEFTPVDVVPMVRSAVEAIGERFSAPNSKLEVDLPAELPKVRGDREALTTVVLNLLDNAWKYSGDQKAIQIRAYAADSGVSIEVRDNGVGLSRRAMRRIFDRFYQVDQTLSRQTGGCGLGLAIVKFILDAHGGTIDVRSQVGKGSVFTVRLPCTSAHEPNG